MSYSIDSYFSKYYRNFFWDSDPGPQVHQDHQVRGPPGPQGPNNGFWS